MLHNFAALTIATMACARQLVSVDSKISDIMACMKPGELHTQKIAFDNSMTYVNSEAAETSGGARES
jgi:hypothetical protein